MIAELDPSADVTSPIPEDLRADRIYHLACTASPIHFETEPLRILDTCYSGTHNVLSAARQWNARVLLASTSEVYGQPETHPQPESYHGNVNPFGPRSCYDEGKRISEALVYAFRQQHALDVRVARIFNAYGPGMRARDGRVISNFMSAAFDGRPMTIYGDGRSTRCFQYVDDCVEGLRRLMESDWQGGPMNIGSEVEVTIGEMAHLVAIAATGSSPKEVIRGQSLQDDPVKRKPDCTLAREVLGWQPQVSLVDGLERTAIWFRAARNSGSSDDAQKLVEAPRETLSSLSWASFVCGGQ